MSLLVPTENRRSYKIKFTGTIKISIIIDHAFHHTGNRRKKLQRRTRCCRLLCCLIKERTGLVQCKLRIIAGIHIIAKTIIVISRIGYTGKYLSCFCVGNDCRCRTRCKCQLCRFNFQIGNLIDHKIVSRHGTRCKICITIIFF